MIETVTILLPEEEAKKWMLFQQYYEVFSTLVDKKVFETVNGSAMLHFDASGTLQSITRNDILWSRRFDKQ